LLQAVDAVLNRGDVTLHGLKWTAAQMHIDLFGIAYVAIEL
jgi:hypothetical protein